MSRHAPLLSLKPISEINLTPLMDLTFILLITFIITFPLIEQGIPVSLPTGRAAPLSETRSHAITLDRNGDLYLDNVAIDIEALAARVALAANDPARQMYLVRADETIPYGRVVDVLRLLREGGVTRMALVTQAE